ncbi:hypothetical protein JCM10908_006697 [Rhodotorula pacifica]|uniref:uncharacterized protein n=1 Tax=Rhodotorula pacifica TaxID=1495444 RepID=UPI00317D0FC6
MERSSRASELLAALTASTASAIANAKRPRTVDASSQANPLPTLTDIRNDLAVHAGSLAKEVTALTLALKPPVTVDAVAAGLEKLSAIIAKLAYVVELLVGNGALAKRLSWYTLDLLEAFQKFLPPATRALEADAATSRDDVLRAAKTVWTVVDRSGTLPQNELEAERQSWRDAISMLDDCLEELKDLEETVDADEPQEDAGRDEDVADPGAIPGRRGNEASPAAAGPEAAAAPVSKERQRISAARHLLRLGRLLIHRLVTKSASASTTFEDPSFLAAVRVPVSRLCALGDDIALELEPPQDGLLDVVDELCKVEDLLADELERVVAGRSTVDLQTSEAEWMQTWRKQRGGVRAKLDAI